MFNEEVAVPRFGHYAKTASLPSADPGALILIPGHLFLWTKVNLLKINTAICNPIWLSSFLLNTVGLWLKHNGHFQLISVELCWDHTTGKLDN